MEDRLPDSGCAGGDGELLAPRRALFRDALRCSRAAYDQRNGRLTFVGLATPVPALLLGASLLQGGPHPPLKLVGALLVSAPVALGLAGSAGLCDRIGAGLPGDADARQPWCRVLRGGTVLSFVALARRD